MTARLVALGVVALAASSCQFGELQDRSEEKAYIQLVHDDTLAALSKDSPAARRQTASAPGYAVFSSHGSKLFGGHGFGIVHDNRSGAETYMRMADLRSQPGESSRRFRAVFVFEDAATLEHFAHDGLDFPDPVPPAGIVVYQFVDGALEPVADIAQTRYARDSELTGDH